VKRILFETRLGDWLLRAFERLTGLGLVDVDEIDGERVRATAMGRSSARVS